jgi:hypothetical protein
MHDRSFVAHHSKSEGAIALRLQRDTQRKAKEERYRMTPHSAFIEQLNREEASPEYDSLPHVVLSRVVGEANGYRTYTRPLQQVLAGLGCLEFRRNNQIVAAPYPELRTRTTNVSPGREVLERLERHGIDRLSLERMWSDAKFDDGLAATLPPETVAAFIHKDTWPMVRQVVEWGPVETIDRLRRFLRNEARRPLACGTEVGLAERTLSHYTVAAGSLFSYLRHLALAEFDPALTRRRWDRALATMPSAAEFNARTTSGNKNAAPNTFDTRRALTHANAEVERRSKRASTRSYMFVRMRDRAFVGVLAALGPRKGSMIADAVVGNYLPRGDSRQDVPGLAGPALLLTIEKRRKGALLRRWKPLPEEVGLWIEDYLDYANLRHLPDAPLWINGWADFKARAPDLDRPLKYSAIKGIIRRFWQDAGLPARPPHAFRHLAEQIANEAGLDHLLEHPGARKSMSTQVFADALLDHAMTGDALGYKDYNNEPGRMKLAGIASRGLWEHLRGDRGARKGVDRDRVIAASRAVEEVGAHVRTVERQIEDLRVERRAKVERARKALDTGSLMLQEAIDLVLDLGLLASLLDDEQDSLWSRREELHAARAELQASRTDLIALPDDAPETDEHDLDLARTLATDEQDVADTKVFVREWVTLVEAASGFGVSEITMRRWANGQLPHAAGDLRNLGTRRARRSRC